MGWDTNRRRGLGACLAAASCSIILPGLGHHIVRARFRAAVVTVVVLNLIATALAIWIAASIDSRAALADAIADRLVLAAMGFALLTLAGTRVWTAIDSAWSARPPQGTATRITAGFIASALIMGGVAPLALAAHYVWKTDRAIERVFSSDDATTAYPGTLPPAHESTRHVTTTTRATVITFPEPNETTTTTNPTPPTTPPPPPTTWPPLVGEDRVNVLLLGGDAGPGRWGLRTDSMIVVSVDPVTGHTAMISVPRNLTRLPFPPGTPLAIKFQRGFNDIANALYTYASGHRNIAGGGEDAGAQAIKLGIAQLLGMPINYYVLVNMAGFVDVVDALGGIDIDVATQVPSPGNPADAKHDVPEYIEPGFQHMDGTIALAYSRSRTADSDYRRMTRQRCVLAAIATSATPMAVATGLPDLVGAFGDAVRTDIPRDHLGEFAQLIDRFTAGGGLNSVRTLHLAPPLVSATRWDAVQIRLLVSCVVERTAAAPAVPATPSQPVPRSATPAPVLADAC
ncbi:MAG: LCP family protein [Ilumatobacteraceae bacterium]|nr:LCP family protein [Ilumatobacteraceae bacterium]